MELTLLEELDIVFKKTPYLYLRGVKPRSRFSRHRGRSNSRIEYNLPDGRRSSIYGLSDKVGVLNEKKRNRILFEFNKYLLMGFFPEKDIQKLSKLYLKPSGLSNPNLLEAVNLYYTKLNHQKWEKSKSTIPNERATLIMITRYFVEKKNLTTIREIKTEHLKDFNRDVERFKSRRTKGLISPATQKSYKKILKAFLNCISYEYELSYDLRALDLRTYFKGKLDSSVCARTIVIPETLLDLVDKCSYKTSFNYPDRKEVINFFRRTGICKQEFSCLSLENLYNFKSADDITQSIDNFNCIYIRDKDDCPTKYGLGLTVKSKNRERYIPLGQREITFIKNQIAKHSGHTIFGKTTLDGHEKYIEYRFLFPVYRNGIWQRCNCFLNGIRSLLKATNDQFELGFECDYTVHDFRNTINDSMGDKGMEASKRSYLLGHSIEVNQKNYSNYNKVQRSRAADLKEHLQRIEQKQPRLTLLKSDTVSI